MFACVLTHWRGLTREVVHEAGLGGDDPLCSGLTEDGHVVFGLLTQRRQAAAQLGRCRQDLVIGAPAVLTQDYLQQGGEGKDVR